MSRKMQIFHQLDEKIADKFLADFHQDRLYVFQISANQKHRLDIVQILTRQNYENINM